VSGCLFEQLAELIVGPGAARGRPADVYAKGLITRPFNGFPPPELGNKSDKSMKGTDGERAQ